ncbi:hypothetical protein ACF1AJ_14060 [Leifsonia sp. NPDC014704]|uniref:hypothetical protein n=1 Tax=Leifsonia sp. NPDC014704 TaxID=3364123 RepID=UPI0036F49806
MSTSRGRFSRAVVTTGMLTAVVLGGSSCAAGTPTPSGTSAPAATPAPAPGAPTASGFTVPAGPQIVFRNTEPGDGFGKVATVPLTSPSGKRTVSGLSCERVDASREALSCLSLNSISPVGYRETLYDGAGAVIRFWPLSGPPSRTRLSPDSRLVAWTAFVDGESYANVKFSTLTTITSLHGTHYGPLDAFTFLVDAQPYTAVDLNFWGVTFADDGNIFYATAASAGHTWLVRGNLRGRTVVALQDGVECPSLSPDGTRVAYKKNLGTADAPRWTLAVLDLASGKETVLPLAGSVDDQAEWLDDRTVLFGLPVAGKSGDFNVYSAPADGSAPETLLMEHAWSPSVVR